MPLATPNIVRQNLKDCNIAHIAYGRLTDAKTKKKYERVI